MTQARRAPRPKSPPVLPLSSFSAISKAKHVSSTGHYLRGEPLARDKERDLSLCVGELFSCGLIYARNDWPARTSCYFVHRIYINEATDYNSETHAASEGPHSWIYTALEQHGAANGLVTAPPPLFLTAQLPSVLSAVTAVLIHVKDTSTAVRQVTPKVTKYTVHESTSSSSALWSPAHSTGSEGIRGIAMTTDVTAEEELTGLCMNLLWPFLKQEQKPRIPPLCHALTLYEF
ncbi:hypothetical protein EYF80_021999 [Liparis tanakae]|uniref:Uncharacterized protein n=1 Tax=Liparis tanakae TaxID=230148 RepID=A0A4Z2HRB2_9TELE|nr:hypothetical protein EYF80_021999 [Liparis tanakae]